MKVSVDWNKIWAFVRKYGLNKYMITLYIFAAIMLFVGDQSLVVRVKRARQIHQLERQRDEYRQGIEQARHELELLENKDSLERFAREQYLMCAPGEDVFVVK